GAQSVAGRWQVGCRARGQPPAGARVGSHGVRGRGQSAGSDRQPGSHARRLVRRESASSRRPQMTDAQHDEVRRCVRDAQHLLNRREGSDRHARLLASAVRVLADASGLGVEHMGSPEAASQDFDDSVWQLAVAVTTLRGQHEELGSVDEAVAALQLLSSTLWQSGATAPSRIERLREIDAAPVRIRTQRNGPYLLTHAATLTDWLGRALIVPPTVALCRCGASTIKPFCDGAHAQNGFDDRKDPTRVANRQDPYVGQQLTVLDNRGICAHSGFCTDHLPTVFHQSKEQFVTPSGARLDDIVHAVRACPSGALSYAVDGREAREQVDVIRPPGIEISRDGPYRI